MKILAGISRIITIVLFVILCLNVLYFWLSILVWALNIKTAIFYPAVGTLIPIVFLANMGNLFDTCHYEENPDFYYKLIKNDKIKIAIYLSMGLINPMLLYLHTKSYNRFVRLFWLLSCLPVVNIFMYLKLVKKLKQKGYENNFVKLYFKGMLILTIIREEIS